MRKPIGILIGFVVLLALGCEHVVPAPPVYIPDRTCKPVGLAAGSEPTGVNALKWGT